MRWELDLRIGVNGRAVSTMFRFWSWRWREHTVWSAPLVRFWGLNRGRWSIGVAHRLTELEAQAQELLWEVEQ